MSRNLSMADAAAAAGLSWERFRKIWPQMVREESFPAPIHGKKWDADAVEAWRKARSERNVVAFRPKPEVQDPTPKPDQGRRARAALASLRSA